MTKEDKEKVIQFKKIDCGPPTEPGPYDVLHPDCGLIKFRLKPHHDFDALLEWYHTRENTNLPPGLEFFVSAEHIVVQVGVKRRFWHYLLLRSANRHIKISIVQMHKTILKRLAKVDKVKKLQAELTSR